MIKNNLKVSREKKGLTQVQVAEKAQVAIRSYQYIEAGERIPNVYTAIAIAKVLNTNVEKIFSVVSKNNN